MKDKLSNFSFEKPVHLPDIEEDTGRFVEVSRFVEKKIISDAGECNS